MKLVHYSPDIVTRVRYTRQPKEGERRYFKPAGFWVSDESDYGWLKWCKDNRFHSYNMRYKHEVVLKPDAKILYIRTPEEVS